MSAASTDRLLARRRSKKLRANLRKLTPEQRRVRGQKIARQGRINQFNWLTAGGVASVEANVIELPEVQLSRWRRFVLWLCWWRR